jgi:multicomponent Na+:H+ antiporter subunit G
MTWLHDAVVILLLGVGGLFCLLAALGIVLMSDLYNRMQAASKAVTLGATCIVLAAGTHFASGDVITRCVLVCLFFVVTVPVASHLIARAAHRAGEPLAAETVVNDLAESDPQADAPPKTDSTEAGRSETVPPSHG